MSASNLLARPEFRPGMRLQPSAESRKACHASGAAARADTILSKKEYETEPFTSVVNEDLCSGCATCVSICPYDAIALEKQKDDSSLAKVDETLCMGCGACVVACPSGAMQQKGFNDKQMLAIVTAFAKEGGK